MEEDLETVEDISSNTWRVMENNLKKEGFREGAFAGNESVFQKSFDAGYTKGFRIGYAKGFLKGVLSVLKDECKEEVVQISTTEDLSLTPCCLCGEEKLKELETNCNKEAEDFLKRNDELDFDSLINKYSSVLESLNMDTHILSSQK